VDGFPFSRRGFKRLFAARHLAARQFAKWQTIAIRGCAGLSSVSVASGVSAYAVRARTLFVRLNQRSGTRGASSKNPKKRAFLRALFRFHTGLLCGSGDVALERWFGRTAGIQGAGSREQLAMSNEQ
jgi:hypothetical protein